MEQYEIPPARYFDIINYALEKFKAENIYIRLVGSCGGTVKVNEDIRKKRLSLQRCRGGLRILIDHQEKFLFQQTSAKKDSRLSGKYWSVAFCRIDSQGRMHHASTGYPNLQEPGIIGPDDPRLPKVRQTIFRSVNSDHLMEISFAGKIPICCTDRLVTPEIRDWLFWDLDYTRIKK